MKKQKPIETIKKRYQTGMNISPAPPNIGKEFNEPNTSPYKGGVRGGQLNNLPYLKTFRKQLRNSLTPAEAYLWKILQKSQLDNRKFRRQHSIDNYILDFYCPAEKLAIELDGEIHNNINQAEYDKERDLFLVNFGVKVLRFENKEVFNSLERVINEIKNEFGWSNNLTTPTPPKLGGELNEPTTNLISSKNFETIKQNNNLPLLQKDEINKQYKNSPPFKKEELNELTSYSNSSKNFDTIEQNSNFPFLQKDEINKQHKSSPPFKGGAGGGKTDKQNN